MLQGQPIIFTAWKNQTGVHLQHSVLEHQLDSLDKIIT